MTRQARILLALDDGALGPARGALEAAHHQVHSVARTDGLEHVVATFRPDVVIIDLPIGDPSHAEITVQRIQSSFRPILLWAVPDGAAQRAMALEAGADACIDAPFSTEELVLNVRALLRRSSWLAGRVHRVGVLVVDEDAHVVVAEDETVHVSLKEFNLLAMLASHAGTVLSKRTLLEAVWGYDAYDENLVEVHMSALRRRLPPKARGLIHTVRGVGYVLRDGTAQGQLA